MIPRSTTSAKQPAILAATIPVAVTALRGDKLLSFQIPPVPVNDKDTANTSFDPIDSLVPQLGVFAKTLDVSLAISNGLRSALGVYVVATTAGNQETGAALAPGDVIASVNGEQVLTVQDLRHALRTRAPGELVVLEMERQRQFIYSERELDIGPPDSDADTRMKEQQTAQAEHL